jgi:hypothetical protein
MAAQDEEDCSAQDERGDQEPYSVHGHAETNVRDRISGAYLQTWLSCRTQVPPWHCAKVSQVLDASPTVHACPSAMTVGQMSPLQSPTRHRTRSPHA